MTPKEFTDALTDRLRRRGADFRPEDVEAFAAVAWLQERRRPDPDVWAERFLARIGRREHLARKCTTAFLWDRRALAAAGWATAGLLLTAAVGYSFAHWPASTLAVAAVALIVAAVTLSRFPIESRVLRWILLVGAVTALSVAALVVLLATRCHL